MVEPVAQPPERVPGHLIGNLSVDLHGERDPAVPKDGHHDTRVNVERGQAYGAPLTLETSASPAGLTGGPGHKPGPKCARSTPQSPVCPD